MKNPKAEDRRVRRTKAALRHGLVELMRKKPISNITVKELAEKSDVSRGTFYKYYNDIEGMSEAIKTDMAAELRAIVQKHTDTDTDFPRELFVGFYSYLKRNSDFRVFFMSANGNGEFVDSIVAVVRRRIEEEYREVLGKLESGPLDYFFSYNTAGCISLFGSWIAHGMKESPEEMAALTVSFIVSAVDAVSGKE